MAPINIQRDDSNDTVTIEGIVYSQQIFRDFGFALPQDRKFSIVSRDDGVLVIHAYEQEHLNG